MRDPRVDPRAGDVLLLHHVVMRVEVTNNDGTWVRWIVRRKHRPDYDNGWSLDQWRKTIAPKAKIIHQAEG